ncbi:helix-turn-helix domain-containing protein [Nodosilinea sp. E11]|uniref:helix-turn-helix domain-containing protein n=1 Tax=Nodosilinea sp. E11 TaxID=3037479 RepID=UPI0029342CA5|nr:helix-turn-helix domain-containing protein [Nodosilinea sp. E11]WOD38646.1 helix-turn-helix domain-containing protein [Nodosilinea sp. E11]
MAKTTPKPVDYSERLRSLMNRAGLTSYRALSQASGVSRSGIDRLRQGQVEQLRVSTLQHLSLSLGLPLAELVEKFSPAQPGPTAALPPEAAALAQVKALRQECDRLQAQLTTQADTVRQQVQQAAIAQLEPWLVQWPTAAHAAQQKPDLPAHKLIPLLRPVETLVQQWGVTPIESVGDEVLFDPQIHQPKGEPLTPGQPVRVSHVGYRQGDRLLHRAKVSPVQTDTESALANPG